MPKYILIAFFLLVSACGFTPLYYKTDIRHNNIYVNPIAEFMGQKLRFELSSRLSPSGFPSDPDYYLDVILSKKTYEKLGLREDSTSTRYTVMISALITLKKDGKVVFRDNVSSKSSYDILSMPYATVASSKTAEENIIIRLADQIALRIDVFLKNSENKKVTGK